MNKVEAFIMSVPYLKAIMREDVMITVFDHEKYLYYAPTKELNFNYKIGAKMPDIYLNYALVDPKGPVILKVPAEEFGIPFDSINIPIKDEQGNMIGAINAAISTQKTADFTNIINTVETVTSSLVKKVQNIESNSSKLTETTEQMAKQTASTVTYSTDIQQVAGTIKTISDQTNLLGLNAAIEAARVGAEGAGFGVVATEIRKLSRNSKTATDSIENTLKNIIESLENMQKEYEIISKSAQEEALLVNDFLKDIERLQQTSEAIRGFFNSHIKI